MRSQGGGPEALEFLRDAAHLTREDEHAEDDEHHGAGHRQNNVATPRRVQPRGGRRVRGEIVDA